jgi:hypothetical protein
MVGFLLLGEFDMAVVILSEAKNLSPALQSKRDSSLRSE